MKRICHQLTKNDETAIISNMMKQGRFRKAARGAFLTLLFFYYNMNDFFQPAAVTVLLNEEIPSVYFSLLYILLAAILSQNISATYLTGIFIPASTVLLPSTS